MTLGDTAHARVGGRGEPGFWQILGNVMNTSMLIGLVFVVLACVAFLFMDRINRSDEPAVLFEIGSRSADETVHYPDVDLRLERRNNARNWVRKDGTAYD